MPYETVIYGSGNGKIADTKEKTGAADQAAAIDQEMKVAGQLAANPLTAPLAPLAMAIASLKRGGLVGRPMAARDFSPWGEVVPTTTTKALNQRNIF